MYFFKFKLKKNVFLTNCRGFLIDIFYTRFGGGPKGTFPPRDNKKHRINREIKGTEFRVIDPEGNMLGVMSRAEAVRRAEMYELDLIEIAPKAIPPVIRIMDYGKFVYEIQKKEKIQKKNQVQQQMKEIRFKSRTDTHDFNFKTKHAKEFLEEGNKVKASVMFRGREITHKDIGRDMLDKFVEALQEVGKVDNPPKMEGRNMTVILAPLKNK